MKRRSIRNAVRMFAATLLAAALPIALSAGPGSRERLRQSGRG